MAAGARTMNSENGGGKSLKMLGEGGGREGEEKREGGKKRKVFKA